jgi:hypothetical protein
MSCIACGGPEQRCCRGLGRECDNGLECTDDTCELPIGCPTCPSTQTCKGSACVDCGDVEQPCCGTGCNSGFICNLSRDRCEPCGGDGATCCPEMPPCSSPDHECSGGRCEPCGGAEGALCCTGAGTVPCTAGFACEAGAFCTACGATDRRCCPGDVGGLRPCATDGDDCVFGYCRAGCGGVGEPCCLSTRCAGGLICNLMRVCATA